MDIFDKIDKYKAAVDCLRPFEGQLLGQLKDYYRIGLTYSSNALEGNTLTESETKVILEDGLTVGAVSHCATHSRLLDTLKPMILCFPYLGGRQSLRRIY